MACRLLRNGRRGEFRPRKSGRKDESAFFLRTRPPLTPRRRLGTCCAMVSFVPPRVSFVCLWSCAAALRAVQPTRACVSMSASARAFTPNKPRDGGVISEPAAQWALGKMSCVDVELDTPEVRASVRTTFLRPEPSPPSESERPLALFLHGADFSCLEWRLVMRPLLEVTPTLP